MTETTQQLVDKAHRLKALVDPDSRIGKLMRILKPAVVYMMIRRMIRAQKVAEGMPAKTADKYEPTLAEMKRYRVGKSLEERARATRRRHGKL